MRNCIILSAGFALLASFLKAQAPQVAVVRPDGASYICPTPDSAYSKAMDGDFIYLPGGSFYFSNPIRKKLFIYGAGCNPDSSQVTNPTIISGTKLMSGADGGSITGCYLSCNNGCTEPLIFSERVNGYSISYCFLNNGIKFDSACTNIVIANNIIGSYGQGCLYGGSWSIQLKGQNNYIANNYIAAVVSSAGGNIYSNNIFPYCQQFCSSSLACTGELFMNNIFACTANVSNCVFRNNIGRPNGIDAQNNQGYNNSTLSAPIDSLFVSFPAGFSGSAFWSGNLHLRPGSPYLATGTDGTQPGIYGGTNPVREGWIPANPHIYFKQVAPNTNANGELLVQFKVRTNN